MSRDLNLDRLPFWVHGKSLYIRQQTHRFEPAFAPPGERLVNSTFHGAILNPMRIIVKRVPGGIDFLQFLANKCFKDQK